MCLHGSSAEVGARRTANDGPERLTRVADLATKPSWPDTHDRRVAGFTARGRCSLPPRTPWSRLRALARTSHGASSDAPGGGPRCGDPQAERGKSYSTVRRASEAEDAPELGPDPKHEPETGEKCGLAYGQGQLVA